MASNITLPVEAPPLHPRSLQAEVIEPHNANAGEQHQDSQQGQNRVALSESSDDSEDISDSEQDSNVIHSRISSLLQNVDIDVSRMMPPKWEGALEMSHRLHSVSFSLVSEYATFTD